MQVEPNREHLNQFNMKEKEERKQKQASHVEGRFHKKEVADLINETTVAKLEDQATTFVEESTLKLEHKQKKKKSEDQVKHGRSQMPQRLKMTAMVIKKQIEKIKSFEHCGASRASASMVERRGGWR